jgi:L-fuculose-phosphate aldolase
MKAQVSASNTASGPVADLSTAMTDTGYGADLRSAREELVACGVRLLGKGLLTQTSGNLSIRLSPDAMAITPTSIEYDTMKTDDIVVCGLDGTVLEGSRAPSSETPLHAAVYQHRDDIRAIVHTHSAHATTLAILGRPIPAVHYIIASLHTTTVPVAPYATYGTPELAASVRDTFQAPGMAVLIANHGMVAGGRTLKQAADGAETTEILAGFYYRTLTVGQPNVLSSSQMNEVFAKYRRKPAPAGPVNGSPAR